MFNVICKGHGKQFSNRWYQPEIMPVCALGFRDDDEGLG